MKLTDSQVKRK